MSMTIPAGGLRSAHRPALLDADLAQKAQREVTFWSQPLPLALGMRPPPGDACTASERLQEAYRQFVAAGPGA